MFKEFKRRINTVQAVQLSVENRDDLIAEGIVHKGKGAYGCLVYYNLIDQVGEVQEVKIGMYIAKEPRGGGYYRIDEETFLVLYYVDGVTC